MKRVVIITTGRFDYSILRPLIFTLNRHELIECQLVVTGLHFSPDHGNTIEDVRADGVPIAKLIKTDMSRSEPEGLLAACGLLTTELGKFFAASPADLMIVAGDRFELLSIAQASLVSGVPLAHIHGGERTEGSFDDSVRDAVSLLSQLHFVATDEFGHRLKDLGVNPTRVFNVGSLGVEAALRSKQLSRQDVLSIAGIGGGPFGLVTVHPETRGTSTPLELAASVSNCLDKFPGLGVVVTASNTDPGGNEIDDHFRAWVSHRNQSTWIGSLGSNFYSFLAQAEVIIGNSSSGIIEAPALGTPTINVGTRQAGRPFASSITTVDAKAEALVEAMQIVLQSPLATSLSHLPYGQGQASQRILEILLKTDLANLTASQH